MTDWWCVKSLPVLWVVIMHSHVAHKVQTEPILSLFPWDSVWAGGPVEIQHFGCVSAGLSVCVCVWERERRTSWYEGGGGCKSEQHLLPGLWRMVWGQQRPISHRSYLLRSSQRQFVLAADRTRDRKGKNRLFIWGKGGNSLSMSSVFGFFSARGLQRQISHWCWLSVPHWNHNYCRMIFWVLESFFEK